MREVTSEIVTSTDGRVRLHAELGYTPSRDAEPEDLLLLRTTQNTVLKLRSIERSEVGAATLDVVARGHLARMRTTMGTTVPECSPLDFGPPARINCTLEAPSTEGRTAFVVTFIEASDRFYYFTGVVPAGAQTDSVRALQRMIAGAEVTVATPR